jgi:hypothetical protein
VGGPDESEPWPDAPIRVTNSDSLDLIAEAETNRYGKYLIRNIPKGIHIDIQAKEVDPIAYICEGIVEGIFTGLIESEFSQTPTGLGRITSKLRTTLFGIGPQPQKEPYIEIDDILAHCYAVKQDTD